MLRGQCMRRAALVRQGRSSDGFCAGAPNFHLAQGQPVSGGQPVVDDLTGQRVLEAKSKMRV